MDWAKFMASLMASLKSIFGVEDSDEKMKKVEEELKKMEPKEELKKMEPKEEPKKDEPAPVPPLKAEKKDGDTDLATIVADAVKSATAPLQEKIDALEGQVNSRDEQDKASKIDSILSEAIAKGRIAPDQKDTWKGDLEKAFDTTAAIIGRLPENPSLAKQAAAQPAKKEEGKDGSKSYSTAFARGSDPKLMKYVEDELAKN